MVDLHEDKKSKLGEQVPYMTVLCIQTLRVIIVRERLIGRQVNEVFLRH